MFLSRWLRNRLSTSWLSTSMRAITSAFTAWIALAVSAFSVSLRKSNVVSLTVNPSEVAFAGSIPFSNLNRAKRSHS